MSALFGSIHFWLYNKIGKQEELTKAIASHAAENGWISDQNDYIKDLPALDTAIDIDCGNIHSWLQEWIHDAELRKAAYHAFDDIFVNGMPCDRVNAVISECLTEQILYLYLKIRQPIQSIESDTMIL